MSAKPHTLLEVPLTNRDAYPAVSGRSIRPASAARAKIGRRTVLGGALGGTAALALAPGTASAEDPRHDQQATGHLAAPGTIYAADYCAEDGTTDDGPNLQQAFDDLVGAGGGVLALTPGKTYVIDTDVDVDAAGVTVDVAGSQAVIAAGANAEKIITIQGSSTPLPGDNSAFTLAAVGDNRIETSSDLRGDVSAGDYLMIWSSNIDNGERPDQYRSGEFARVVNVTGDAIVLDRSVQLDHVGAAERRLFRIDPAKVKLSDLTVILHDGGQRQVPLTIRHGIGVNVSRFSASGKAGRYGLYLNQCMNVRLDEITVEDIYDANSSAEVNGYGIYLGGVVDAKVVQPRATRCRHAVDIGSYSSVTLPGVVSMDIAVEDGTGIGTWAPAWSTHHARRVSFTRIRSLRCGGGALIRAIGWAIRDFTMTGYHTDKPDEWSTARYNPAVIGIGESSALPNGLGDAGSDVVIDNLTYSGILEEWPVFAWSDAPGDKVSITGPGVPIAPDVVFSDSADRRDGPAGKADLRRGGRQSRSQWRWQQSADKDGVVIANRRFARLDAFIGHGLRTNADVPADAEISATWDSVGKTETSNGLFLRGSNENTVRNGYFLGVKSDGSVGIYRRVDGNSSADLAGAGAGTVADGDRIALRVMRRQIQALVNGSVVAEVTDTAITGPGRAGFYFRSAGGDEWEASDLVCRELG
jgi:hypothetical protein